MIEQKTVIDQIEIARSGEVRIRFGLLLVEDGKELDCKWHRTTIAPGADLDAQMAAVDAHLQSMGKETVEGELLEQLKPVVDLVHSPESIKKFDAERAALRVR